MVFAYDFFPGAETLSQRHFNSRGAHQQQLNGYSNPFNSDTSPRHPFNPGKGVNHWSANYCLSCQIFWTQFSIFRCVDSHVFEAAGGSVERAAYLVIHHSVERRHSIGSPDGPRLPRHRSHENHNHWKLAVKSKIFHRHTLLRVRVRVRCRACTGCCLLIGVRLI